MYNNSYSSQTQLDMQAGLNAYISKIYGTMFLGLLVTALAAWFTANSYTMINILYGTPAIYLFIIAELIIVISLSARINKISYGTAKIMYYAYSIINGITLSSVFLAYNLGVIYTAFFTTAISFGIMAIYGMTTKKDLTKVGNVLMMLLIGVIVASIINIFVGNSQFDLIISFAAVAIFVGLVAYDTQKLKSFYYATNGDYHMQRKIGIIGALSLYLDFINIFLYLLRIFGNGRRD
ncbi:MAG: Bax inhibitor-1/YccA family protein [Clostridia bacterium]|nr:Bax inhibitor-1/YccA family protein [Clostridia bacterium]